MAENPRAFLFAMDYAARRRVKLWGRARAVEDDPALLARLAPAGYAARPERALLFDVEAWDVNCPSHIPERLSAADIERIVRPLRGRIAALLLENRRLRLAAAGAARRSPPTGKPISR